MMYRAFCAATLIAATILLSGCSSEELITGITQRQANQAVALLQRYHLEAQKREIGKKLFAVYVAKAHFAEAVGLLDEFQLPSRDNLDIADLFPIDSLVNSPTAERARLISGVEQRLEQTAKSLDHVLSARVHISYPLGGDGAASKPMRVSMVLIRDMVGDDTILIQRLKTMIKNSVESISYNDISVEIFYKPALLQSRVSASMSEPNSAAWASSVVLILLVLTGGGVAVWRGRRGAARVQGSES